MLAEVLEIGQAMPSTRANRPVGHIEWLGFDHEVLRRRYHDHHGAGPKCIVPRTNGASDHPILTGVRLLLRSEPK